MTTYTISQPEVLCMGDIHGNFNSVQRFVQGNDIRDTAIVVLGDIGLGFDSPDETARAMSRLRKECRRRNVQVLFLRGNHDDPAWFDGRALWKAEFKALADYTVLHTVRGNILCVGGAVSIDRTMRQRSNQCLWWPDEGPVYDGAALDEIASSGIRIDAVFSHTAPAIAFPIVTTGLDWWFAQDPQLRGDLALERQTMSRLLDRLRADGHPIRAWFYGHFHQYHNEVIDGIRFVLLDCESGGSVCTAVV